jgi:hypothetical protein
MAGGNHYFIPNPTRFSWQHQHPSEAMLPRQSRDLGAWPRREDMGLARALVLVWGLSPGRDEQHAEGSSSPRGLQLICRCPPCQEVTPCGGRPFQLAANPFGSQKMSTPSPGADGKVVHINYDEKGRLYRIDEANMPRECQAEMDGMAHMFRLGSYELGNGKLSWNKLMVLIM